MRGFDTLEYRQADGIAFVVINRPDVLNALNSTVFQELKLVFEEMIRDEEVKVVILTGNGERAFAAGADIRELQKCSPLEARQFALRTRAAQQTIAGFPKPVIAALNGYTLGGGLEVAMCCDIRIASSNAKIGQPEINLGFIPGGGGTQRLARLIGPARAKELVFSGQIISAAQACEMGLVSKVVSPPELMAESEKLAGAIARKSAIALEFAKIAIDRGLDMDLDSGLQVEIELFGECFATFDCGEGIAAFLEKRQPVFKGK